MTSKSDPRGHPGLKVCVHVSVMGYYRFTNFRRNRRGSGSKWRFFGWFHIEWPLWWWVPGTSRIQGDFFLRAKSKQLLLYHKTRLLHKNLYPHNHHIGTFGLHMRTNHFTYLHAHRPCSKWALFSRTQGWALLTQQCCWNDIVLTKSSGKNVTAVFRASWLKVLNARTALTRAPLGYFL